jgi:hypothetical protein
MDKFSEANASPCKAAVSRAALEQHDPAFRETALSQAERISPARPMDFEGFNA